MTGPLELKKQIKKDILAKLYLVPYLEMNVILAGVALDTGFKEHTIKEILLQMLALEAIVIEDNKIYLREKYV